MTEHNNPAGPAANKDTLRAELANALHDDWCGCDSWDGVNCEGYHEGEFPESADAALAVVARLTRERDEAQAEVSRLEHCYDAVKERAERAEARPAIPADALAKPDGVLYALLRVWLDSPLNRDSSERAADAAASAVRHWSAPVSGSDTTEEEDVPDSAFVAPADPGHPAWTVPIRRMQPWPLVSSGGGTDTTAESLDCNRTGQCPERHDHAPNVAAEVLALAEQQQTRPAHTWRVGDDPGADRALMLDAVEYVINRQLGSTSALQRNIRVGFAKAGQLMDLLETWGVVGPAYGSMAREVLVPKEQLHDLVEAIRGGVK